MRQRKQRPAVFDLPSRSVVAVLGLSALTLGFLAYPFIFHAFGPSDSPFDQPAELLWIFGLAVVTAPFLAAVVLVRRVVLNALES